MSSFPNSVQGAGTVRVQYVPTLIDPLLPTLAELAAGDAFDATAYFRAEDFVINHEQEVIDDTRLSDEAKREALGLSTFSADALRYVHNPQAAAAAAGNKAYDKFVPGNSAYFVVRFGTKTMKSGAAFAATQRVQVYSVTFGDQHQPTPVGDNAVHVVEQKITLNRVTGNAILPT